MVMLQCSPDTAPPPLIPLGTTANPDDVNGERPRTARSKTMFEENDHD